MNRWLKYGVLVVGCWLLLLFVAAAQTWYSLYQLEKHNLSRSSAIAKGALSSVTVLSATSIHLIPDLEVWRAGLTLLSTGPHELAQITKTIDQTDSTSQATTTTKTLVSPWLVQLKIIDQKLPHTWLLKYWVNPEHWQLFNRTKAMISMLENDLLAKPQTWVILFQNSDELRPTGGFMGSLAFVKLSQGSITNIEIQDIYQADGQFMGHIEPPAGVKQYLSGGESWRLPDANWSPDFPQSATQILQFLDQSGYQDIEGAISLNLETAADLLRVTGPIYLPDYQTTLTSDNLATMLRQNRDEFFPGSVAKQHLLQSFFTQFKLKLLSLPPNQQLQALNQLKTAAAQKQLQFFALNLDLQALFEQFHVAGVVPSLGNSAFYFFPIEANVGINKANQKVDRNLKLEVNLNQTSVKINFVNSNLSPPHSSSNLAQADHLHYVNYQRFLVSPETKLENATYNGLPIDSWSESLVTTTHGETLKQIGFLITVHEQSSGELQVVFSHPSVTSSTPITIGKQSGIRHVPLDLTILNQSSQLELTTDLVTTSSQLPTL